MANKIQIEIRGDDKASAVFKQFVNQFSADADAMERKGKRLSDGMGSLTKQIIGLAGAYGLGRLAVGFVNTASKMDQMKISLDTITKGRGEEWFERLNEWALKMPVNTEKAIQAFTRMRAMGLEPTIDQMTILVDTTSALGGSSDTLEGISRALGQIATKGKVSAEELMQLAERGVPAYEILKEELGLTSEELGNIGKAGIDANEAIEALLRGMAERFGGQSERIQKSWAGLTESLVSYWKEFQRLVAEANVMKALEKGLGDVIDKIDELKRTGQLDLWAEEVGQSILTAFEVGTHGVEIFINAIRGVELVFSGTITAITTGIGWITDKWIAFLEAADKLPFIGVDPEALENLKKFRNELEYNREAAAAMSVDLIDSMTKTHEFFGTLRQQLENMREGVSKAAEEFVAAEEKKQKAVKDTTETVRASEKEMEKIRKKALEKELDLLDKAMQAEGKAIQEGLKELEKAHENQIKNFIKLSREGDSFIDGMKAGFFELGSSIDTWGERGYDVVQTFSKKSENALDLLFKEGFRGNLDGALDALEKFGNDVLDIWLNMIARMVNAWVFSGLMNLLGFSPGGIGAPGTTGAGAVQTATGLAGLGAKAAGFLGLGGGAAGGAAAYSGAGIGAGGGGVYAGLSEAVGGGGFFSGLSEWAAAPGFGGTLGAVGAFYGAASLVGSLFRGLHGETHPGVAQAQSMNVSAVDSYARDILSGKVSYAEALGAKLPLYEYMFDSGLIKQTGTQSAQAAIGKAVSLAFEEVKATSPGATTTGKWASAAALFPNAPPEILEMVATSARFPKFQGGGIMKKTGLALAHEGEGFFTKDQMRELGLMINGGSDRPIHVHVYLDGRRIGGNSEFVETIDYELSRRRRLEH